MKYEVDRRCLFLIASFMMVGWFASPSWATPPTPPAAIAVEDAQLTRLEPREGIFVLPLRIQVRDEIKELAVHWRLIGTSNLERKALKEGKIALETNEARFTWRATDHVSMDDVYGDYEVKPCGWDFYHVNSVQKVGVYRLAWFG